MDIERLREHVAHFRGTLSSLAGEPPTPEQRPMHDLQTICDHVLSSDKSGPVDARELKKALRHLRMHKYWPPVGRLDNVSGDRQFVCACPPISTY